jgi:UDP-N-acetylmuramoyl-L-alanyl-D-glutamate--2,6-diaminopimelate ligase
VSSHALDQGRCAGVRFQTAVFTNLSRDHLDYHGSMERYGTAKARLFDWPTLSARVINVDDPFGVELAGQAHPGSRLIVTTQRGDGIDARLAASPGTCIVRATKVVSLPHGLAVEIEVQGERMHLKSALLGEFNVGNLLGVLGCLLALDVSPAEAVALLERGSAPPGRMQTSGGGDQPLVIVDYAHTADALEKALQAARAHCAGRLWCVFGCGGDRDPGKRAPMGRVAERLADEIIITDDNPRDEDPAAIVQAILAGVTRSEGVTIEHDRATAIGAALMSARVGDVVLIAGKGHETHQVIGPRRQPFSDIAVVRAVLAARGAA